MIHQININSDDFLDRADFENSINQRTCYCVKRTYMFNDFYTHAIKDMKAYFHDMVHMPKELEMGPLYISGPNGVKFIVETALQNYIRKLQNDSSNNPRRKRYFFF